MQTITVKNEEYIYDKNFPLVSIHLGSNRPDQFTLQVENIESTCSNKNAYEIVVKVDEEDEKMIACVKALQHKYGEHKIKPYISPRDKGPWSLWKYYNEMFSLHDPHVYFFWNPSDEVRFETKGWDLVLEKYIGFYKDHIFRLKLSDNRLRNFYRFVEVLGCPDNFPFMTKKWMDICGLWGDCHSPDLFHQAVSFYLGKKNVFRDFPIFDIEISGIEAGLLIPPSQSKSRTYNINKLWQRAISRKMRNRYLAHANKINFYLESYQHEARDIHFKENLETDYLECRNDVGDVEKIHCKDKVIFYDEIYFNIKISLAYRFYKFARFAIIQALRFPKKMAIHFLLKWKGFDLVPAKNKQSKLSSMQNKTIDKIKHYYYLLVKENTDWELCVFDNCYNETKIPISQVSGLANAIESLPSQNAERIPKSSVKSIKKIVIGYHVKRILWKKY